MEDTERVNKISRFTTNLIILLYGSLVASLWWAASFFGCVPIEENLLWCLWVFAGVLSVPIIIFVFIFIGFCLNLKEIKDDA